VHGLRFGDVGMTVSGVEGSVESRIRAKAKTALKIDLDFPPNLPNERYVNYANTLWIRVDDVLAILTEHEGQTKAPFSEKAAPKMLESYAELAHQIWSEMIDFCFRVGAANGSQFQRREIWEKWHGLSRKQYSELTEKEKESDRAIARRYLELLTKEGVVKT